MAHYLRSWPVILDKSQVGQSSYPEIFLLYGLEYRERKVSPPLLFPAYIVSNRACRRQMVFGNIFRYGQ